MIFFRGFNRAQPNNAIFAPSISLPDGPGLLDNPEDLIVDGKGRIYILDQDCIEIFDNSGTHLKLIPDDYEGHAYDIKLDLQGNVYIITNAPQVYKLKLNLGE